MKYLILGLLIFNACSRDNRCGDNPTTTKVWAERGKQVSVTTFCCNSAGDLTPIHTTLTPPEMAADRIFVSHEMQDMTCGVIEIQTGRPENATDFDMCLTREKMIYGDSFPESYYELKCHGETYE